MVKYQLRNFLILIEKYHHEGEGKKGKSMKSMKNLYKHHNMNVKIIVTFLLLVCICIITVLVSLRLSRMEEQACWDELYHSINHVSDDIEKQTANDQIILESIAGIIAQEDEMTSERVRNIIDTFYSSTFLSNIALLLPGDRIIIPNEPVLDGSGKLSFEEEAALGKHISDRATDIRDGETLILRNFVPVVKDGETVAMLYGIVDLDTLPEKFENTAYGGEASIYLIDASTGDFIMDTWHHSLGNLLELGSRETRPGYSEKELLEGVSNRRTGKCVFVSKTTGDDLYFYYQPIEVNQWVVAISAPESLVFSRMDKINRLLIMLNVIEMVLIMSYFLWIILITRKELKGLKDLAETDALTGLLNRNSYENALTRYHNCEKALNCIYIDANGLHEINNTYGHDAGDKMLQEVARVFQAQFGKKNTYRIGGDEFLVFAMDKSLEEVEKTVQECSRYVKDAGYYVSVGISRQEAPVDTDTLVKSAEALMYEAKSHYYEERGRCSRR